MSFILDALKRSEQERASNTHNPAIAMDIADTKENHHKRFPWTLLLISLALVAAAVILFLFKQILSTDPVSKQPDSIDNTVISSPEKNASATTIPEQITEKPETRKQPIDEILIPPPPLATQSRLPETKQPRPLAQQLQKKPVPAKPAKAVTKSLPKPTPEVAKTAATEASKPVEDEVPSMQDISDSDQNMLSAYEINTHFYSDTPGKSFALINMKKYREGDSIQGTQNKIEQITADGVVINYGKGRVLLRSH